MPILDGFGATAEIRRLEEAPLATAAGAPPGPAGRRVPVLAFTTFSGSDILPPGELEGPEAALGGRVDTLSAAVGLDGVVTKPVAFGALQAIMAALMHAEDEAVAAALLAKSPLLFAHACVPPPVCGGVALSA